MDRRAESFVFWRIIQRFQPPARVCIQNLLRSTFRIEWDGLSANLFTRKQVREVYSLYSMERTDRESQRFYDFSWREQQDERVDEWGRWLWKAFRGEHVPSLTSTNFTDHSTSMVSVNLMVSGLWHWLQLSLFGLFVQRTSHEEVPIPLSPSQMVQRHCHQIHRHRSFSLLVLFDCLVEQPISRSTLFPSWKSKKSRGRLFTIVSGWTTS